MTPKATRSWPAQTPGADFADRTVAAIVRDRATGHARARPRRWLGVLGVAAVLAAAGAWAGVTLPRASRLQESPRSGAPKVSGAIEAPAPERPAAVREPEPERPGAQVPPFAPAPRPPREPALRPDAGRAVRVPRCNCVQAICDCGEEP